jgi:hypothetical protein
MKQQARTSRGKSPTCRTNWNNPEVKLRVSDHVYLDMVNCVSRSFVGLSAIVLETLADLPNFVSWHERVAAWARDCGDVNLYFRFNQVASILKKLELPLFTENSRANALAKWHDAEAGCKEMNVKCFEILKHPLTHSQPELDSALQLVRKEIFALLGEVPPDLDEVAPFMRFGKKASLTHKHNEGSVVYKLQNSSAYKGMEDEVSWLEAETGLFAECLRSITLNESVEDLSGMDARVTYFDYAKLDFVPKSISELRTIEIGPSLATLFQQAYDGFIRQKLNSHWGLDLRKQDPNQRLAYVGSVMGEHQNSPCTIDLSAASDRISYGIVAMLLPPSWVRTLARYRAKRVRCDEFSSDIALEKFSSMGNALTFSLQTLIFGAVVRSVLRERGFEGSNWRVYGDDIIVPRRIYDFVVARLELFGFKINSSKSFSNGNFRESCGADYLHGTNVRPLYIKEPIRNVADLYKYLNLIQIVASRAPIPAFAFAPLYRMVLAMVPKRLRLFGDTRHALDSCIWARTVDDEVILSRRHSSEPVPDKLAYLACLFLGYGTPRAEYRLDGKTFTMDVSEYLLPPQPHMLPSYQAGQSFTIRRAPNRGLVVRIIQPSDLPFDPLLLD